MKKTSALGVTVWIVLIVLGIFTLFPLYMAVINSLKSQGDMFKSVLSFPLHPTLENYREALTKMDLLKSFFNTLIITAIGLCGIIVFSSMAGYKLSRTSSKLSGFIFLIFVSSILVPFHTIMITLMKVSGALHIQGKSVGLGLIYIGLGVNMAVFLYHGFVKSIPVQLDESATVDGCGQLQLFFKIIFPLLTPITATIAILDILWFWNDFMLPMLMLDSNNYTLVLSSYMFFDKYNTEWSNVLASLVITTLPVIVFYFLFQKYIIEGITAGAVKG